MVRNVDVCFLLLLFLLVGCRSRCQHKRDKSTQAKHPMAVWFAIRWIQQSEYNMRIVVRNFGWMMKNKTRFIICFCIIVNHFFFFYLVWLFDLTCEQFMNTTEWGISAANTIDSSVRNYKPSMCVELYAVSLGIWHMQCSMIPTIISLTHAHDTVISLRTLPTQNT